MAQNLTLCDEYGIIGLYHRFGHREALRGGDNGGGVGTTADVGLSRAMQWFKTMTTNHYIRGVKEDGWPPFEKRVWQRNYYDHIIRHEEALMRI
ncbi:MAG: hypothetical protein DCF17_09875 [Shackletoniella antarctica]|jgi:hypothetical protein|uniref:Uncharacterized protein n=1 Tax=Shackletoniella antarctica TaxID=268115 RepID=A0A2W4Y4B1_9CYAN|nr:MAG: hypothetical protein DCF17_09875 [Shackletoniella antarctica]